MIPDGLDPDDYIKKFGSEKFKNDVIGASVTMMTFKMNYFRKGRNLSDEGDRLAYINDVLKAVSLLSGPLEQEIYIKQLANEFSISFESLKDQLSVFEKQAVSRSRESSRQDSKSGRQQYCARRGERRGFGRLMKMQSECSWPT